LEPDGIRENVGYLERLQRFSPYLQEQTQKGAK
jgi:hypothetical protein